MIFNSSDNNLVPNFSIVGGTTEPAVRMHNTIWVKTDKPITEWRISNDPLVDNPDGLLWIKTGATGIDMFSAFENDAVMVFPVSAALYYYDDSGKAIASDRVPVRRYNADGSYVDWGNGYIFNAEYDPYNWVATAHTHTAPKCGQTLWNDIVCMIIANEYESSAYGTVLTDTPIDLSQWNTLTATIANTYSVNTTYTTLSLGVWTSIDGTESSKVVGTSIKYSNANNGQKRALEVDVSELDGLYYVGFYFSCQSVALSSGVYISEIKLS